MTDDLAPCPKCGGEVIYYWQDVSQESIECSDCNSGWNIEQLWNMVMEKESVEPEIIFKTRALEDASLNGAV